MAEEPLSDDSGTTGDAAGPGPPTPPTRPTTFHTAEGTFVRLALDLGVLTEDHLPRLPEVAATAPLPGCVGQALVEAGILSDEERLRVLAAWVGRLQPNEDNLLGQVAVMMGLAEFEAVEAAQAHLEEERERGRPGRLGEALLLRGVLSPAVLEQVLLLVEAQSGDTFMPGRGPMPGEIALPDQVGKYRILALVGRGGMGMVYRARHVELGKIVAVKTIRAGSLSDQEDIDRFFREARTAAELIHPGIVQVHDVGVDGTIHYYAMDFVEGRTLAQEIRENILSPRRALEIVGAASEALAYAHSKGVLHRDMKPSNILLSYDGKILVTDFGVALHTGLPEQPGDTDILAGTPAYMAPEQLVRSPDIDGRADVYSLGAVLYETLTGRPPFEGSSAVVALKATTDEPLPPSRLQTRIHRDIETICLKCLEKDPDKRYESASALAADVSRYLEGEPVLATRPGVFRRFTKRLWRNRALSASLAAAAVATLAAVFALVVYQAERSKEQGAWELVFSDDFERSDLGNRWRVGAGSWHLHEGALCAAKGSVNQIFALGSFPGDVRLTYETWAEEWPVCSLSSILCGSSDDPLSTGYYLGFGDNYNVRSYILRRMVMATNNPRAVVERGKKYRVTAERLGSRVSLYVDDQEVNSFEDFFPLQGENHATVGFYSFFSHAHFDNVKIYVRRGAEKLSKPVVADLLYQEGAFLRAAALYREAARGLSGREAEVARFKEALSLLRGGQKREARFMLSALLRKTADPLVKARCAAPLAEEEFRAGSVDTGWGLLVGAGMGRPEEEPTRYMAFSALQVAAELEVQGELERVYQLKERLLRHYGGNLIPAYRLIGRVFAVLSREGRHAELLDLVTVLKDRVLKSMARANDIYWFVAPYLAVADPDEAARILLRGLSSLEKGGWFEDRIRLESFTLYALILARAGRHEIGARHFDRYELYRAVVEGRLDAALKEARAVMRELPVKPDIAAEVQDMRLLLACLLFLGAGDGKGLADLCDRIGRETALHPELSLPLAFKLLLVLAELARGRPEKARSRLTEWLSREPDPTRVDARALGFLAGTVDEASLRKAWRLGLWNLMIEDGPWSFPFWTGVRAELAGEREIAVVQYRKAKELIPWRFPAWYVVRAHLKRLGEK